MRCGGITGWRKIAASAEGKAVEIVSHTYPQVAVHLVCGTSNAAFVEDYPLFDDIVGAPLLASGGVVTPSTEPGIGVDFASSTLAEGMHEQIT
jgi:L-alanine-DL-glutamate epimerase-like enolase superfamily enzyme